LEFSCLLESAWPGGPLLSRKPTVENPSA